MKNRYLVLIAATALLIVVLSGCFFLQKPLTAPKLLSPSNGATDVSTSVTLKWASSDVNAKYEVLFGTDKTSVIQPATSTYLVENNLAYSTTYYWEVIASAEGKSVTSYVSSFTTIGIPSPSAPVLSVTSASTNSVTLEWTQSEFASSVYVFGATSDVIVKYATLPGVSTSFTVNDLSPSTAYRFFVVGNNASGRATSNTVDATTSAYVKQYAVIATIPVGHGPNGVGVDANTDKIYVSNMHDARVSVIDGNTNTVIKTINVGFDPWGVGVDANTDKIYVANCDDGTVSVIDGTTNTVATTIRVGNGPAGVGIDTSTHKIYVANWRDDMVSVIDGTTNTVIKTIRVGNGPRAIGVDANTHMIYVANPGHQDYGTVSVIDGNTNTVAATITVGSNPLGVGVDANTHMIYVANWRDNTVSVIDGKTNTIATTITVGHRPQSVGIDVNTDKIYVSNWCAGTVSVIDGKTNTVDATINVGYLPVDVGVDANTHMIYVANVGANTVSVIK